MQPSLQPTAVPTAASALAGKYAWVTGTTSYPQAVFTAAAWGARGTCAVLAGSASSGGVLIRSCDGGATWTSVAPLASYSYPLVYTDVTYYRNSSAPVGMRPGYFIAATNIGNIYISADEVKKHNCGDADSKLTHCSPLSRPIPHNNTRRAPRGPSCTTPRARSAAP